MKEVIKKLEKEISKTLKENTKLLEKENEDAYDMDDHDSIFYNDGFMHGLEKAIYLLNKQKTK
jgi:hypothetical protein